MGYGHLIQVAHVEPRDWLFCPRTARYNARKSARLNAQCVIDQGPDDLLVPLMHHHAAPA